MEFLDRDLEFLAGTGAGVGLDFYDVKDITKQYQCASKLKFVYKGQASLLAYSNATGILS
jgi:hypothetical protein